MPVKSFQPGDIVGPYHLVMVFRDHTDDGRVSDKAIFRCPSCGNNFECSVFAIRKGRKQYCNNCAYKLATIKRKQTLEDNNIKQHDIYKIGDKVGPDELLLVAREREPNGRLSNNGTFICPQCQKLFSTNIQSVARGIKHKCNDCANQRRYREGEFYGINNNIELKKLARNNNEYDLWTCPYCGQEFYARRGDIQRGHIQSCGCYRSKSSSIRVRKNLEGNQYGNLTVLHRDITNPNLWKCQCKCGRIVLVGTNNLISGKTKSCGCFQRERSSEANSIDLPNLRFGKLYVVKRMPKDEQHSCYPWLCQCECGRTTIAYTTELTSGYKKNCGCEKNISLGELRIQEILDAAGIRYCREWTHQACRMPNSKYLLRFDFYIYGTNKIIEFDGRQHFENKNNFTNNNYYTIRQHDLFKDNWCKDNGYFLLRIPYTQYGNLIQHPEILFTWLNGENLPPLPTYEEPTDNDNMESSRCLNE